MTAPSCFGAGFAASVLLAVSAGTANATAVTVGSYYQETTKRHSINPPAVASCGGSSYCYMLFNLVPQGRQLLITDVSCNVIHNVANSVETYGAEITHQVGTVVSDRSHQLDWIKVKDNTPAIHNVRAATRHLVKAGERPLVFLVLNSAMPAWSVKCTVTGNVGNPPP